MAYEGIAPGERGRAFLNVASKGTPARVCRRRSDPAKVVGQGGTRTSSLMPFEVVPLDELPGAELACPYLHGALPLAAGEGWTAKAATSANCAPLWASTWICGDRQASY
jgi:hypothetical protein